MFGLFKGVLPGRTVEYQQYFVRCVGHYFLHHTFYLGQFGHQVCLVVEPSCGVYYNDIGSLGFGRRYGVECHGSRVRAHLLTYHRDVRPIGPHGELVYCRSAESIGSAEHHFVTAAGELRCELAYGGGFACAVNSHDHYHVWGAVFPFDGKVNAGGRVVFGKQSGDFLAQYPVQFVRTEIFVPLHAGFYTVYYFKRCVHPYVRRYKGHFEFVECFFVYRIAGGDKAFYLVEKR